MRCVLLCLLAACSLRITGTGTQECSGSPPPGSCTCDNGTWWCSTCSFYEGGGSVACSQPGATCEIETWEHGCDCSCGSDGWWSCSAETVGSHCPSGPPDAGIDVPPDAVPPDAAPCSRVEAENIGEHPGWNLLYGMLSGDRGLSALAGQVPLQFDFTGTTLGINHEIGPTGVPIAISIDGGANVVVQGYQAVNFDFVTSPVASGLANGQHHASVVCEGAGCAVDYFDVTCF